MLDVRDGLASVRAQLDELVHAAEEHGAATVTTGVRYSSVEEVRVRVRRRGRRYDLDDEGTAVLLAGRQPGWLERIEQVAAAEGFNVNRRGVVSVPAVEGRDIAALAIRLGEVSRAAYLALLDARAD